MNPEARLARLMEQGVVIPHPASVYLAPDLAPGAVAPGVVLHPGTRLLGAATSIGPACVLGEETPLTVDNCQLGHGVRLKGGFVQGSVFLDGASLGSAAHVRPGCLLEEEASAAHAVGLKQTILFPFVTLGSLINFCDVLMAGGTSRRDHGEVGSSYIHFNFTPHGDKATASLLGEVPSGVLLDQRPIFLGGQGGIVGPVTADYGTVVAAGNIVRRPIEPANHLQIPKSPRATTLPYDPHHLGELSGRVLMNCRYIGNLFALSSWYRQVRLPSATGDAHRLACVGAAIDLLDAAIAERLSQLGKLLSSVARDPSPTASAQLLARAWPAIRKALEVLWREVEVDSRLEALGKRLAGAGGTHLEQVQQLSVAERDLVRSALQPWVDRAQACAQPQDLETT